MHGRAVRRIASWRVRVVGTVSKNHHGGACGSRTEKTPGAEATAQASATVIGSMDIRWSTKAPGTKLRCR